MEPRPDATPAPELTFLTQDEVRRLFAVITGRRDRALFPLAYHHGLRASEVSLLQRHDIHDRQGRIYIPRVKGSVSKTYLCRTTLTASHDLSRTGFVATETAISREGLQSIPPGPYFLPVDGAGPPSHDSGVCMSQGIPSWRIVGDTVTASQ
jgi:integrase